MPLGSPAALSGLWRPKERLRTAFRGRRVNQSAKVAGLPAVDWGFAAAGLDCSSQLASTERSQRHSGSGSGISRCFGPRISEDGMPDG